MTTNEELPDGTTLLAAAIDRLADAIVTRTDVATIQRKLPGSLRRFFADSGLRQGLRSTELYPNNGPSGRACVIWQLLDDTLIMTLHNGPGDRLMEWQFTFDDSMRLPGER